jgi:hypothetical protein
MPDQLRATDKMVVCALTPARRLERRGGSQRRNLEARKAQRDEMTLMEMALEAARQSDEAITEALTDPDLDA